jgi:hypothetical protein
MGIHLPMAKTTVSSFFMALSRPFRIAISILSKKVAFCNGELQVLGK